MDGFRACFAGLDDPRSGNAQRHELDEIMMIALVAMLCGAASCVDMALFGRSKEPLLRRFLRLPGGVPSHDTFSRIFRRLDPGAFEACFTRYLSALADRVEGVVAVDGKTARRSFDRQNRRPPLHLISAGACEQRLVLGQRRVDDRSNEIVALPELLALLALEGCIVTADAMHCQKDTAQTIVAQGGGGACPRAGTAGPVGARAQDQPAGALRRRPAAARRPPGGAGRPRHHHRRRPRPDRDPPRRDRPRRRLARRSPRLPRPQRGRQGHRDARAGWSDHHRDRYYLLSRPLAAAHFLAVVRAHWQIENCLHWVLDVVLDEDLARARKDHAPENLARLRRFALNVLRVNHAQGSIRGKIKRAGWDDNFLLSLLATA